jgi:hypothetical protein
MGVGYAVQDICHDFIDRLKLYVIRNLATEVELILKIL